MVSQSEIDRLRLEADTIMTRIQEIKAARQQAQHESGDHWETGTLDLTLETPQGESIALSLSLEEHPADCAQARYERAKDLETRLERKRQVAEQLQPLPADPLAYLVCYHLDTVEGNYPKSIAGHLKAERTAVQSLCEQMETEGVLERVESGTVKQRRVKAKMADEVRQHHTYYRLSRTGDHLLRFLSTEAGQRNVLLHLPDGRQVLNRLQQGRGSPREIAAESSLDFEYVRHLCRALLRVGLVTTADVPTDQTDAQAANHTYYALTKTGGTLVEETP